MASYLALIFCKASRGRADALYVLHVVQLEAFSTISHDVKVHTSVAGTRTSKLFISAPYGQIHTSEHRIAPDATCKHCNAHVRMHRGGPAHAQPTSVQIRPDTAECGLQRSPFGSHADRGGRTMSAGAASAPEAPPMRRRHAGG